MQSRSIQNYGSPKFSAIPATNPEVELNGEDFSRLAEDAAQMTRTSPRAIFSFETTTTVGPIPVEAVDCCTVWGEGDAVTPAIEKTATGTYAATFAEEYEDDLVASVADAVSETEQVNFRFFLGGKVRGSTKGDVQADIASNVVTIYVFDSSGSLSDLSGGKRVEVLLR